MQNYIEAVHDELDEALEKITKLEAERDEARRWASVWKRAAKYHREWNMYFEKKCFEWQGRYFKMKDRAEAAEVATDELELKLSSAQAERDKARYERDHFQRVNAQLLKACKGLLAALKHYKPLPNYNPDNENEETWSLGLLYKDAEAAIQAAEGEGE